MVRTHYSEFTLGKEDYGELLRTVGVEFILIRAYPISSTVRLRAYKEQGLNGLLIENGFQSTVVSPDPKWMVGMDLLKSWKSLHIGLLTCAVIAIVISIVKYKVLKLPLF